MSHCHHIYVARRQSLSRLAIVKSTRVWRKMKGISLKSISLKGFRLSESVLKGRRRHAGHHGSANNLKP